MWIDIFTRLEQPKRTNSCTHHSELSEASADGVLVTIRTSQVKSRVSLLCAAKTRLYNESLRAACNLKFSDSQSHPKYQLRLQWSKGKDYINTVNNVCIIQLLFKNVFFLTKITLYVLYTSNIYAQINCINYYPPVSFILIIVIISLISICI